MSSRLLFTERGAVLVLLIAGCVERGEVLSKRPQGPITIDASITTPTTGDSADESSTLPTSSTSSDDSSDDTTATPDDSSLTPEAGTAPSPPQSSSSDVDVVDAAAPAETTEPEPEAGPPPLVSEPATAVSSGANHACAVFTSGIACWGSNVSGQLGLGDALDRSVPTLLPNTAGWVQVHAAAQHSCAVDAEGGVWCWGANDRGQLATGDRQSRPTPVSVTLPVAAGHVATRFNHVCALLDDASLHCWGENFEGQLGQADTFPGDQNPSAADALSPVQVVGSEWLAVDTGQGHTCAIASDGGMWCWGRNTRSELGAGTDIQIRQPQRVDEAVDWVALTSGQACNLALKDDGSLWAWGFNLGYGDGEGAPLALPLENVPTPTRVGEQLEWRTPSTRNFHSCALRADELWCWGRNTEGQLGLGDNERRTEHTFVGSGYVEVSAGPFGTCAVTSAGEIACTGKNDVGELGTGDAERRNEFSAVLGLAR